jgi:hypothetical protein
MAWNKDKPAGGDKIRLSDDYIRANNEALENAFSEGHEFSTGGNQTGKHTTPTFVDNGADPAQPTATNEGTLYNNTGKFYYLTQAGVKRELGPIPPGTKMLFKQGSAPSGWTFKSEDNDRVLINTSTQSQGGDTGGSWTISGMNVQNHALSEAELPKVSGWFDIRNYRGDGSSIFKSSGVFSLSEGNNADALGGSGNGPMDKVEFSFGGGNSHDHGIGHDGDWRPSYAKVITCQKD